MKFWHRILLTLQHLTLRLGILIFLKRYKLEWILVLSLCRSERHFKFYTGTGDEGAQFRQSVSPSQDGNTVELHVEQMQFSENVMRYQTSLEFLNRKFSGLMSAIKGELDCLISKIFLT